MPTPITQLASAGGPHVAVWDPDSKANTPLWIKAAHKYSIISVSWSPDANFLASTDGESFVVYDALRDGTVVRQETLSQALLCLEFRPGEDSGNLLACGGAGSSVYLAPAAEVKGGKVEELKGHSGSVTCMGWRADGAFLATGSVDRTVRVWSITRDSGQPSCVLKENGHVDALLSVAWPDGSPGPVSTDADGGCCSWDMNTQQLATGKLKVGGPAVVLRERGTLFVFGDRHARITRWDEKRHKYQMMIDTARDKGNAAACRAFACRELTDGAVEMSWSTGRITQPSNHSFTITIIYSGTARAEEKHEDYVHFSKLEHFPLRADNFLVYPATYPAGRLSSESAVCRSLQGVNVSGQGVAMTRDGSRLAAASATTGVIALIEASGNLIKNIQVHGCKGVGEGGAALPVTAIAWHSKAKDLDELQQQIKAKQCTPATLRKLLVNDSTLANSRDTNGRTPLHLILAVPQTAIISGDGQADDDLRQMVDIMLEFNEGAASAVDESGYLPLHLAASRPEVSAEVLEQLLKANPKAVRQAAANGHLPLHIMVRERGGEPDAHVLVRLLLTHGRDTATVPYRSKESRSEWMPAQLAVEKQATGAVLRELLEADSEAASRPVNKTGTSLLIDIALLQRPPVVEAIQALLERGPEETIFSAIRRRDIADAVKGAVLQRPQLAWAIHKKRQVRAIDDAIAECRQAMQAALHFLGRYDIDAGPAAHISATCIVMFATDYTNYNKTESSSSSNLQAARGRRVALKLMHSRSQFFNELKCRSGLDKNHVVPVIRVHVEEDQKEQVKETRKNAGDIEVHPEKQSLAYALHMAMQRKADELEAGSAGARAGTDVAGTNYAKWLEDDPDEVYCLVMDLADRNLSMAIMHERFTGRAKELHTIKKVCLDIAEALRHLHQDGKLAHCDMKPLNAVRVWQCWKVIDMDVSCQLGQPFGDKAPSSGYCPPEMAKLLLECTPSDKSRLKTYKGSEAYDMWSLGCVLFHLCTSETMWHTDQDDNVKEDDLKVIAALSLQSKHALEQRLMLVKQRLADAPKQADLAYDLLQKLLQPSPEDRIRDLGTMTGVCKHPFLEGARDDQEMSPALLKHLSSIKRRAEQQIKLIESQGNLLKAMDVRLAELFRATRVHTRMLRELLLKEEEVPSLVIFLPPKPREGVAAALPEWVAKPESLFAQTLKLHFVCGVSMRVANTNNGEGFDVPFTKSWVRSAAPYLTAGLTVLKIAVAGGRLAGLPIPSLADSMDRILGTIKDAVLASDLMGGSGEDTVSSMFDKIRDKAAEEGKAVGEHLFSPSQDMPELCQEMKKSAAALKRVLPEDWESLVDLKPTVCIETGTKVWCLPEYQADIEERGIGSYLSEGPANQTIPPVRPENGRHGHSRPRSSTGLSAQPIGSAVSNGKPASKMCTLQ